MKFIKKYITLIIPGAIVLFAAGLYLPTKLIGDSISANVSESFRQGNEVDNYLSKPISGVQWEIEQNYQELHKNDIMEIVNLVKQSSQRDLISYGMFPAPPKGFPRSVFDDFGQKYIRAIEDMLADMKALDAPSEMEILNKTDGKAGAPANLWGIAQQTKKKGDVDLKRDAVCRQRAEDIVLYANPNAFGWYKFWKDWKRSEFPSREEAIENCWNSQVAYWIYEDIADTIKAMNAGSDRVYNSNVKRLLGVSFQKLISDIVVGKKKGKKGAVVSYNFGQTKDVPEYIFDEQVSVLQVKPWTDRKCTKGGIDVVHFSVGVILNSRMVLPFMKEICSEKEHKYRTNYSEKGQENFGKHNQITILKSDIEPVDRKDNVHYDYRYGSESVVRLDLVCEYIIQREGYKKIMPASIKEKVDSQIAGPTGNFMKKKKSKTSKSSGKSKNKPGYPK